MKNNITIRQATVSDINAVIEFYGRLHHQDQKKWIEIMMDGRHPYINTSNFIIAQDTVNGKIVASAIYMPWTYTYGMVPLKGVRLEEVFCEPEYQNQGIMKAILRKISLISSELGYSFEVVYVMNAIYNHLDYIYGLPNEEEGYSFCIDGYKAGNSRYQIYDATDNDIPLIAELYKTAACRNLITTCIGCKEIYYMKNVYVEGKFYMIRSEHNQNCGFVHTQINDSRIYMMEIDKATSYYYIRDTLINFFIKKEIRFINLKLGLYHPCYIVFDDLYKRKLLSENGFIQIRNIPVFLKSICCVLKNRLDDSPYAHYTGDFTLSMHNKDEAYKLRFNNGELIEVIPISQMIGNVCIERSRFIRLVVGRISPKEIDDEFSMYYFENIDLRNLFKILFPKMQSHIVSVN